MRRTALVLGLGLVAWSLAGCAGPTDKLGRGIRNSTELLRGGQIRRSMEQTALWEGPDAAYTTGLIRGMNRTLARTGLGFYEVVTFPFPPYHPLLTPTYDLYPDESIRTKTYPWGGMVLDADPPYPANYYPKLISDSIFDTDTALGFGSGDVLPKVPGSRFRIFD
ncbi:MAG TPA: exosortase system-associated protein, TIGR04073 family [Verrucomicrobiae bacterium]|nr:exosortase system-associated protein, TIGR04073 family [Verrucomicrobiae bacterium]